jgi:hypothetical protein
MLRICILESAIIVCIPHSGTKAPIPMAMWLIWVKQGHIREFTYGGIPGRVDLARRYSLGLMGLGLLR